MNEILVRKPFPGFFWGEESAYNRLYLHFKSFVAILPLDSVYCQVCRKPDEKIKCAFGGIKEWGDL